MGGKKAGKTAAQKTPKGGAKKGAADDEDLLLDAALEAASLERGKASELSRAGEESAGRGDLAKALRNYSEAISVDPNNGVHFAKRSAVHLRAGNVADATADAKVAAGLGGTIPQESAYCHCQLGYVLFMDGQLQAAQEAYENGLKCDAEHAGCLQGRDEVVVALEQRLSGKPRTPVKDNDDVEVTELLTLPAPEEVLGKGFEVVHLMIDSCEKPLSFLLATTLHNKEAVITPSACNMLKIAIKRTVDLKNVSFKGGYQIGSITDCEVSSFLQAQIAEQALGTTLHGMLGLPFLKRFDMVFDRVRREQHFKDAGSATKSFNGTGASRLGVVHLRGISLPAGLLGLPVKIQGKQGKFSAFPGIADTSSMFSVISWQVAKELNLASGPDDPSLKDAVKVVGATKDGPAEMPLVNLKVHLCAAPEDFKLRLEGGITKEEFEASGIGKGWGVKMQVENLKPSVEFGKVNVAIGEAIQFALLGDSAVGGLNGGILIGQDILSQAPRLTLSLQDSQVWLDPPGRIVDAAPI